MPTNYDSCLRSRPADAIMVEKIAGHLVKRYRTSFALGSALLLVCFLTGGRPTVGQQSAASITVELLPVEVDPRDPERVEFDRLQLLSAYQLRSTDARFGGLSGLAIGADGKLYAVSDRGFWLSASMRLGPRGRLLNLSNWQIARLLTPEKTRVDKRLTDAEALARAPDGSFVVAFEQSHRLWRYRAPPETFSSAAMPVPIPSEISLAPNNGGLEAISILPDGPILAIAEEFANRDGSTKAWLIDDGRFAELSYVPSDGHRASDATTLANGDVIVLERRYSFFGYFAARLKLVKGKDIRPGATIVGEELLRLDTPLTVDNFEGVAAMETSGGTVIFLVSDDNYFSLQSTLLLQFFLPKNES